MVVAAHPHSGLQTVTWLFEGEVEHRDSVGSVQVISPGQVNFMTAGRGIAHSELSAKTDGNLHAVQLWLAMPDAVRNREPFFENCALLPVVSVSGATVTVFAGRLLGQQSPATMFTDSFGAEIVLDPGATIVIPIDPGHETGVLIVDGTATVNGTITATTAMAFTEPGGASVSITSETGARVILLGGTPFTERLVMWWNFVERSHAEIRQARENWESGDPRFGEFSDHIGGRIPAPELPNVTLQPRG